MKKQTLLFLLVFLIMTVTACGKKDSRKAEEAELDAVSSSINGILTEFTGSTVAIKTEDGKELSFDNCTRAQLECKNGIIPGNEVILVYVGALKDTDTSKVRIRKIITSDDNSDIKSLAEKAKDDIAGSIASGTSHEKAGYALPASGAFVEETKGTGSITGGVNVRADAMSGSEIIGSLGGGDSVTVTGICDNGWYRIIYEGQTGFIWKDYISY